MRTYAVRVVAVVGLLLAVLVTVPVAAEASCAGGRPVPGDCAVHPHGTTEAVAALAAVGAAAPPVAGGSLPGSPPPQTEGEAPWWASTVGMLVIALVGLLVVIFGGLALAVGLGLLTGRRRRRSGGSEPGTRPDSTGTP